MNQKLVHVFVKEPYRIFFPIGIIYLLWGALIWLPQLWNPGNYPVLAHRYLMLNGFSASFIAGFLMTAVPKFSGTEMAKRSEVITFFLITISGLFAAYLDQERAVMVISSAQAGLLLAFLISRISKRKTNPPYSFIFIFVGLGLWFLSGLGFLVFNEEVFKRLHYEGAIAAIILGVGSRLIPGILGHVEVVMSQRARYEKPVSILSTVPVDFFILMIAFISSYFFIEEWGSVVRAIVVTYIAFKYWQLWKTPKEKTSLTWCIWGAGWLILLSFILRAYWIDGMIHAGHSFFINGIVLLSLLIATRVLQSHGPKVKALENSNVLYLVFFLIVLSASTRVSAYLMPESYLRHLGFSSIILVAATTLWSWKYIRYAGSQS